MKTLLFVDHAPALGGAEKSLLLLLDNLDRERLMPHLACVEGRLMVEATALNVPVHLVPMPRLRRSPRFPVDWLFAIVTIARKARHIGADLIYANTVRAAVYAGPAARLARRPFVWHMRDFWLSENRPSRLWLDRTGKRLMQPTATRVITNSSAVAAELPKGNNVSVVYNGIDIDSFDTARRGSNFRRRYGISASAPLVGTIGRLRPWKGQDRFLRVAKTVVGIVPQAHFVVVGGTPFQVADDYELRLRRLAGDLAIRDRVAFTGHLDDVRPALAAMDVFVHAGEPEPFGLVNVEAMAMARPVVAFAHGALPEIVIDGESGILVPPGDETAMVKSIVDLVSDPERRSLMGASGRQRVKERYSSQRMAAEVMSVIQEVLGS